MHLLSVSLIVTSILRELSDLQFPWFGESTVFPFRKRDDCIKSVDVVRKYDEMMVVAVKHLWNKFMENCGFLDMKK